MPRYILHVTSDDELASPLARTLAPRGVVCLREATADGALRVLDQMVVDLVLIEAGHQETAALALLKTLRARCVAELPVVVVVDGMASSGLHALLDAGATDIVQQPVHLRLLAHKLTTLADAVVPLANAFTPEQTPTTDTYRVELSREHEELPDAACTRCYRVLHHLQLTCGACQLPRPDAGWPRPEATGFELLGQRVNRYFLEQGLGRRGMTETYQAIDTSLGQQVALCVTTLPPERAKERDAMMREIRSVASIDSPNVAAVWDVFPHGERAFVVVREYARGTPLTSLLEGPPEQVALPPSKALHLVRQLGDALDASARSELRRCGLRPDHIIVEFATSGRPFAKIIDLAFLGEQEGHSDRCDHHRGTYPSPEQRSGEVCCTAQANVFALGALLYHLLTGRPPIQDGPRPRLSTGEVERRGLRAQLDALLDRAMAPNPDHRFDGIPAFTRALDVIQAYERAYARDPHDDEDDLRPSVATLLKDYLRVKGDG